MKLSASIPGHRKGKPISVAVSAEDGQVQFEVPSVDRASSAIFDVDVAALREALDLLAPAREAEARP